MCRKPGCAELKEIITESRFIKGPRPRSEAPTAEEIVAARAEAHELGHPEAAFAYALQFEGSMGQWDVIGKWVPLSDKRASSIIDGNKKWLGPMWSQVDDNLILIYTASKPNSRPARGARSISANAQWCWRNWPGCHKTPRGAARSSSTRRPPCPMQRRFAEIWRKVANNAGIAKTVWNRDLRAAAVTEARQGAAPADDVAKVAANSKRMVAQSLRPRPA